MGVRKAKHGDWEELKRLTENLRHYGSFDITMDTTMSDKTDEFYIKAAANVDGFFSLVYERDGIILGCAICRIAEAEAERKLERLVKVHHIYIEPEGRGRKVGQRMFKKIEAWALKQGVSEVSILASAENPMALNFYHKNGFKDYDIILKKHIGSPSDLDSSSDLENSNNVDSTSDEE